MLIKRTTNYSKFNLSSTNREINEAHVRDLVSSISETNLLPHNPIVVNADYEVIDGQHRLEAAKRLGLEIFYTVAPKTSIRDTRLINRTNRPWNLRNYLESYAKEGKPDYIALLRFCDKYGLPVSTGIEVCCGDYDGSKSRQLRLGKLNLGNMVEADNTAKILVTLAPYCERGAYRSRTLIRAIRRMNDAEINYQKIIDVLNKTDGKIKDNSNYRDLLRQFEDIVNYKSKTNFIRLY